MLINIIYNYEIFNPKIKVKYKKLRDEWKVKYDSNRYNL